MKHADPVNPEQKEKFGARDIAKSVFVFLANYVLLFAIIFLSMLLNSVNAENKDFIPFMRENVTSVIYLLFCIFILFVIIFFLLLF